MTSISIWKNTKNSFISKIGVYTHILAHSWESLEKCTACDSGRVVSRCSFCQSVKQGLRTVLLLKLQPCSWAHSAEQIPVLPGFKKKRQQDFPILLPTGSGAWASLCQRFTVFILLEVQEDSGYKTQQIFSWSKDAPFTEQEELPSASLAWWEYGSLSPTSVWLPLYIPESTQNNKPSSLLPMHRFCLEEDHLQADNEGSSSKKTTIFQNFYQLGWWR